MADLRQLDKLEKGVASWNRWRVSNPRIKPDLRDADLRGVNLIDALLSEANLREVNLRGANLRNARLSRADLTEADLSEAHLEEAHLEEAHLDRADLRNAQLGGADLYRANLREADLRGADLHGAFLREAFLREAFLSGTNFYGANLEGANLRQANLVRTNFERANLSGCSIYGISAWEINLTDAIQSNLVITRPDQPTITVDNLEVAQFIHLLLNNEKIRNVIDTITAKVVLILGRFTPERKAVLDAIREGLRNHNYLPILFDFDKPSSQDFIETVSTLAHMARFVIADVTDPKIVLEEVPHIVRTIDSVPVQPLLLEGSGDEPVTLYNLRRNHRSLLDTYYYKNMDDLLESLGDYIIASAEAKAKELRSR